MRFSPRQGIGQRVGIPGEEMWLAYWTYFVPDVVYLLIIFYRRRNEGKVTVFLCARSPLPLNYERRKERKELLREIVFWSLCPPPLSLTVSLACYNRLRSLGPFTAFMRIMMNTAVMVWRFLL